MSVVLVVLVSVVVFVVVWEGGGRGKGLRGGGEGWREQDCGDGGSLVEHWGGEREGGGE